MEPDGKPGVTELRAAGPSPSTTEQFVVPPAIRGLRFGCRLGEVQHILGRVVGDHDDGAERVGPAGAERNR